MIYLDKISKRFENTIIYTDVSYTFKKNALTCFYGPSGSGKTTLFNLLAGFDREFDGNIIVNNIELNKLKDSEMSSYRFNNIGFIFQNYHLIKGYTVLENILMAMNLNEDISDDEKNRRCLELLDSLNLNNEANQKVETLSGGQKQRVAIARALVNDPDIILSDEPTGALDIENSTIIMKILKDLSKKKTVLIITHDDEVLNYADEIITLECNKIKTIRKLDTSTIETDTIKKSKSENAILSKSYSKKLAIRNFLINKFKYILACIIIAFATSSFIASFSSKSISHKIMDEFKEKNFYYNIGQAPKYSNGQEVNSNLIDLLKKLSSMNSLDNIYLQYNIEDINLFFKDNTVNVQSKVPSALANESLSYGRMPISGKKEIVLSASIANRLDTNIKDLIGKDLILQFKDKDNIPKEISLTVTGITNSSYQDFILSPNIEKLIYETIGFESDQATSISFNIKDFDNIPNIHKELLNNGINVFTKSEEIEAFKNTFISLIELFTLLSYLIFAVGLIVSIVILYKIFSDRGSEIAILSALGYNDIYIRKILFNESLIFSILTIALSFGFIGILNILSLKTLGYSLSIDIKNGILLVIINISITLGVTNIISGKLLKKDKSLMLR